MTKSDLDAIRARADADPVPVEWPNAFDQCAKDRRALLSLIDAYQAREREARELLNNMGDDCAHHGYIDSIRWAEVDAWLAAPQIEGKGE